MSRIFGSIALCGAVFVGVVFADVVAWELRPLDAATISFQISGTLAFVDGSGVLGTDDELAPEVVQGAPFIGLLSYDLSALPQDAPGAPFVQSYVHAPPTGSMGLSITVGSQTFATNPQAGFSVLVGNAAPGEPFAQVDQFLFQSVWNDPLGGSWDTMRFSLVDSSGNAFSSPSLPTMLNVADFDMAPFSREFQITRTGTVVTGVPPQLMRSYALGGTIDTITLIPEPSSLVLGILGLLAWPAFLRKPKPLRRWPLAVALRNCTP